MVKLDRDQDQDNIPQDQDQDQDSENIVVRLSRCHVRYNAGDNLISTL